MQTAAQAEHRPLAAAASSPEELVRRLLDAIADNDLNAVLGMALTLDEFQTYVYPELPASDPVRNTSAEFLWTQTDLHGRGKLSSVMAGLGGQRLELEEVEFTGGVEEYPTLRIHRDSRLRLRDENGEVRVLRLFGSVLELDGQFKIFSFNYND
jgi:hypothetical protein